MITIHQNTQTGNHDSLDFSFLLLKGSQDCPNFRVSEIDKRWDSPDYQSEKAMKVRTP
ncbi:MAG: hypothetical protein WCJ71_05690 [Candidatus Omnitrophota bacterium]